MLKRIKNNLGFSLCSIIGHTDTVPYHYFFEHFSDIFGTTYLMHFTTHLLFERQLMYIPFLVTIKIQYIHI